MNTPKATIDVKSFLIGLLAAALVFVLATGRTGEAQNVERISISAGADGVYILNGNSIRYKEKRECVPFCQ